VADRQQRTEREDERHPHAGDEARDHQRLRDLATEADVDVAIIDNDAEVIGDLLIYPAESTAGNEQATTFESLRRLGIKVR
jgi:hypothetical protein